MPVRSCHATHCFGELLHCGRLPITAAGLAHGPMTEFSMCVMYRGWRSQQSTSRFVIVSSNCEEHAASYGRPNFMDAVFLQLKSEISNTCQHLRADVERCEASLANPERLKLFRQLKKSTCKVFQPRKLNSYLLLI